jgi:hypothetical protein
MKRTILYSFYPVLLIQLILLASCISSQSFLSVKGTGMPIDKNIIVSDFNSIEVSGGFDVILIQGNSEDLTLTAQANLFEYITVKVDQGVLKIYTEKNIMTTQPLKARITFKIINNLRVAGGGDVNCETPVNVPDLNIEISGGGDFKSIVNTGEMNCHISGGGDAKIDGKIEDYNLNLTGGGNIQSDIDANTIICDISGGGDITLQGGEKASDANITLSGGGDLSLEINVEKLKCSVSGGGDATLIGQASSLEISINGGGDVDAGNFATKVTAFHASGGSDIHVNVSEELSGDISGGGDVYYSGSPENVNVDARGGSEVHKK